MSLGLVVANDDNIVLAAESEGLQYGVISSKLRKLQDDPELAIVVTGGLEHWRCVFDTYRTQLNVDAACTEVVRLLNVNMGTSNQAYGILCGYDNGNPVFFRINRPIDAIETTISSKETLRSVQVIGHSDHAEAAQTTAETAISRGTDPENALREAIKSRIPGNYLRAPVMTMVIRRAEPGAAPDPTV